MLKTADDHIQEFNPAELGAIAHLYRGEVYRSTIWRTRLDNTTNWSIVTMGIALSTTFSSREASALPLILIGMLLAVFLGLEARRYRYFNVWRARALHGNPFLRTDTERQRRQRRSRLAGRPGGGLPASAASYQLLSRRRPK